MAGSCSPRGSSWEAIVKVVGTKLSDRIDGGGHLGAFYKPPGEIRPHTSVVSFSMFVTVEFRVEIVR
jgi:hypothetical protein